jgi:hypothetical protein
MRLRFSRLEPLIVGALVLAVAMLAFPLVADSADGNKPDSSPTAERLVIRYANGSFELVSRTSLNKVVPPSVSLPDSVGRVSGHWFEVQSEAGKTVYRRRMQDPGIVYTEVPTEENPTKLSRAEVVVPEKTISILVPVKSDGNFLVLYGPPAGAKSRTQAAGEVGRIRLR